jgi:hypothetical protein
VAIIAFLFSDRPAEVRVDGADVRTRLVRTLIAESAAGTSIRATLRNDLVSFEDLAFRPTEVRKYSSGRIHADLPADLTDPRDPPGPSLGAWTNVVVEETFSTINEPDWVISTQSRSDPRAVRYLLSDFTDAYRDAWHTGDPQPVAAAVASGPLTAYAVAPISVPTADRLHQAMIGADGYLGAMEVDAGHPGLFRLLWNGLIPTHQVYDTDLWFIDLLVGHEADRYDLHEEEVAGENWWWGLGASSLYWIAHDGTEDSATSVTPLPDSPRGAAVRAHLTHLTAMTPMEQVVRALTHDPARFPPGPQSFSAARLPNADAVVVPEAKLRGYALNFDHDEGRHKVRLFRDLLNIVADDWRFLAEQLRRGVCRAPALRQIRGDEFGVRFDVITAMRGGSVRSASGHNLAVSCGGRPRARGRTRVLAYAAWVDPVFMSLMRCWSGIRLT